MRTLPLAVLLVAGMAHAMSLQEIDVGDVYYLSEPGQNRPVEIIRIDENSSRVKIRDPEGFTEWVSPSRLLSKAENVDSDLGEGIAWGAAAAGLLCAMVKDCRNEVFGSGSSGASSPPVTSSANDEQVSREADHYIPTIINRVRQFWVRPPALTGELATVVSVRLIPGGDVVPNSVGVVKGSGNAIFDQSVIAAVYNATPIPVPSGPAFERFREFNLRFSP